MRILPCQRICPFKGRVNKEEVADKKIHGFYFLTYECIVYISIFMLKQTEFQLQKLLSNSNFCPILLYISCTFYLIYLISGRHHRLKFEFCVCEPEPVTLLRHHLWPSSPRKPTMCFQLQFMEALRVVYLQGHIPVKDFCEAQKHIYHPYVKLEDPVSLCTFIEVFKY